MLCRASKLQQQIYKGSLKKNFGLMEYYDMFQYLVKWWIGGRRQKKLVSKDVVSI